MGHFAELSRYFHGAFCLFEGKMPGVIPPEGFVPKKFTTQEHYTIVPGMGEGRHAWGEKEKYHPAQCAHGRK
jgi:hypothetical protein